MNSRNYNKGNWVLVPSRMDLKIKIPSIPMQILGITRYGDLEFTTPHYSYEFTIPKIHCSGIKLTKEILLISGFLELDQNFWAPEKYRHGNNIYIKDDIIIHPHEDLFEFRFPSFKPGEYKTFQIEYVHDLQNLWISLTGQELKIIL